MKEICRLHEERSAPLLAADLLAVAMPDTASQHHQLPLSSAVQAQTRA